MNAARLAPVLWDIAAPPQAPSRRDEAHNAGQVSGSALNAALGRADSRRLTGDPCQNCSRKIKTIHHEQTYLENAQTKQVI